MAFVVVVSLGWGRVGLCGGVGVVRTLGSGMVELLVGGLDEGALRLRALKEKGGHSMYSVGVFFGGGVVLGCAAGVAWSGHWA